MPEWLLASSSFVLGAIVSAAVRAAVEHYWSRPRPATKISNVVLGPTPASLENAIAVPYVLLRQVDSSILPDPPEKRTVRSIRDYIAACETTIANHREVLAHLNAVLTRPQILPPAANKDEQRRAILVDWTKYGSTLESLGRGALQTYWPEIPKRLLDPHPPEWKDPIKCRIVVDANITWVIEEVDIEAYVEKMVALKGPNVALRVRREVESSNVDSRIWIYLDAEEVRWYIARTRDYAARLLTDSETLLSQMVKLVDEHTPEYVRVQLMITNDGKRAVAIKPRAALSFLGVTLEDESLSPPRLPLLLESMPERESEPVVIKGGDAIQVTFRSEDVLSRISLAVAGSPEPVDATRIRAFFSSKAVRCKIDTSLTGFGIDEPLQIDSPSYTLGTRH